ncbi:D-alanyl-D-alanine carboxypeptidase family protein [Blautia stercoris]|uniref:D-alanyl-D-alanine carboxypeptidase family protein n=1 Tax=Blautia stercoris TaxID=871664 RepID=UPI00355B9251
MKCTSKSERRRQRNKNLLMGMGVVIVVLLIVLVVVLIKKKDASMPVSFDLTTEVFGQTVEEEALTADGLAADLCVGAGDTALDGVETQGDERAALFDIQNKTLLFSKSLYEKSYPASITKIMTALVAMEHADMDEVVTITASDVALSADSQVCGLAEGDQIQMSELFHALLVYSANDAAMAIARTVGDGSVDTFVQMMNETAQSLGMTGTHFVNPHGLHNDDHYTTVYDIYLMLNEAMKHQEFTDITQLSNYTITYTSADGTQRQKWLDATDQYLTGESSAPKGVTILGGKTGTTDKAGACLALMVQNNYGEPYVSIVLDASNKPELYERMNQLLEKVNHS